MSVNGVRRKKMSNVQILVNFCALCLRVRESRRSRLPPAGCDYRNRAKPPPIVVNFRETAHMTAQILDGKTLAQQFEQEMRLRVDALKAKANDRTPILATILVGADPASATYVKMKGNACQRVGMESVAIELDDDTSTEQLLAKIDELNTNPDVHGILLQHPVPAQIDERACFDAISLEKDVDGVTCLGFGRMRPLTAAPPPKASCACWSTTRWNWKANMP